MPVKSSKVKIQESKVADKKTVIASKTKQSSLGNKSSLLLRNKPTKIATSSATKVGTPRNDKKVVTKLSASRGLSLSIPVYSLSGRESGTLTLPKEIFAAKVNKSLLSQAMRVYSANTKSLTGSTKTRGEVEGSTAKIYRQKGTGRARHGAIRAPIFVGGGIVFGPKPRKVRLDLPKKMKKAALLSALASKLSDKNIVGLSGLDKASGKTKEMAQLMKKLLAISYSPLAANSQKPIAKSVLIVTAEKMDNVVRGVSNIPGVNVLSANMINVYEILRHDMLILVKEAIEKLGKSQVKEQE